MENQTYTGHCHCGAVQYRVQADIDEVMECNCSICSAAGWRLSFIPAARFELLSGQDQLQDYQFGPKHTHHPFCAVCGVRSFSHGDSEHGPVYAVNTRCLDGFDSSQVRVNQFDGASL